MKSSLRVICIFALICFVLLPSCRRIEDGENDTAQITTSPDTSEQVLSIDVSDVTEPETAEQIETEETVWLSRIGFYDDLEENGNYTRLSQWNEPWVKGKDIGVFDIIPSEKATLQGRSYKKLWKQEAEKNFASKLPVPFFELYYLLDDGTEKTVKIADYSDAQGVTDEGYLEVYLYDDIHQEDGAWYYHLTQSTTSEQTVISSFKLTAGADIHKVLEVKLTVYTDDGDRAVIDINNGDN